MTWKIEPQFAGCQKWTDSDSFLQNQACTSLNEDTCSILVSTKLTVQTSRGTSQLQTELIQDKCWSEEEENRKERAKLTAVKGNKAGTTYLLDIDISNRLCGLKQLKVFKYFPS